MSRDSQTSSRPEMNSTSKMSFAVAACAFGAAAIGLLINQWMSGWMAVGGMAGLGLFYLAIGLLNLGSTEPMITHESALIETASPRWSGAMNVDDLATKRPEESGVGSRSDKLANAGRS